MALKRIPVALKPVADALLWAGLFGHAAFLCVSIAGMQIALGVAAAGLALHAVLGFRPRRTPLDLPLVAFAAVALLSDALSKYGPPALISATLWRAAVGFWIVSQGLRIAREPARRGLQLLFAAACGLCAASIVGLIQHRSGVDIVHLMHLRAVPRMVAAPGVEGRYAAVGFFISRLTFANGAAVIAALLAGVAAAGGLRGRSLWAALGALALSLLAIAAAFDRAAWLGLIAAAAVILITARRRSPWVRLGLFASVVLAAAALALHPGVRARFRSAFDVEGNRDRVFLWSRAVEIIRDHPFLGVGFANYPRAQRPYYDRIDPTFPMRTWAHNTELSLLAETGPLGLLALLWLAVATFLALRRRLPAPLAVGALAACAAIAVIGQVHDVLYDTKVMYPVWFAIALGLSTPRDPVPPAVRPAA